ncbi:BEACH domain-containing protein B, partial [Mucuna pruriens]
MVSELSCGESTNFAFVVVGDDEKEIENMLEVLAFMEGKNVIMEETSLELKMKNITSSGNTFGEEFIMIRSYPVMIQVHKNKVEEIEARKKRLVNCLTNASDMKELIPNFFYMPKFLVNLNSYHLGVKYDGVPIGDQHGKLVAVATNIYYLTYEGKTLSHFLQHSGIKLTEKGGNGIDN